MRRIDLIIISASTLIMPAVFRMKVGKDGHSLKVTIPQEIAEALELAAGDAVLMEVTDHKLVVRKSPTSMSLA